METWQMLLGVVILTAATLFLTPALWSSHLSTRGMRKAREEERKKKG